MNYAIVAAVIVQWLIARANRLIGAIVSFVITTGILLWGISAYSDGSVLTFFGVELSQVTFYVICGIWYVVDIVSLVFALEERRQ